MSPEDEAARVEELLAGVSLADRVRPRRASDPELIAFAGLSASALYRKAAAGEIPCEKSPAKARDGQSRGTGAVFFTLLDVARWRAGRLEATPNPTASAPDMKSKSVAIAAGKGTSRERRNLLSPPAVA